MHLFSELYVATQVRGGDMDEFFCHETLSYPLSLSSCGVLRSGEKSEIVTHLKGLVLAKPETEPSRSIPNVGPVIVNQIKPSKNQTFSKYAEEILLPYLLKYKTSVNANRMDVVYNTYPSISLKGTVRSKRGSGIRRKVTSDSSAPSNWKEFLRSSENETEFFKYLSLKLSTLSDSKIICAYDDTVANKYDDDVTFLTPSDHEEADTRVFLHVKDITRKGLKNDMIHTVDTDVLILAISLYQSLGTDNLWVDFGSGKNRSIIPLHDVVLDPIKRKGLRFFFCFTGCDQVSFFENVSKQTAWKVWQVFPQISEVFAKLSNEPTEELMRETLPIIERFVILFVEL